MADAVHAPGIYVIAGVNGAGKSSILGETFLARGVKVFNPDLATIAILEANPGLSRDKANLLAWEQGKRLLAAAVDERQGFAFETTLGGSSISLQLDRALRLGRDVYMSYVGIEGPELNIARVRRRVTKGGHDVPEERIRQRYDSSRLNLVRLLPSLTELRVYDNTADADPEAGVTPEPIPVLHTVRGRVQMVTSLESVPSWAKAIVQAALPARARLQARDRRHTARAAGSPAPSGPAAGSTAGGPDPDAMLGDP